MQVYSNVEIRIDGQLLAESASLEVQQGASEREEKELFLTKAMFRVEMRDAARLLSGEDACSPADAERAAAKPDDPYRQTTAEQLERMWERAQARTGVHVCRECKRREPTTPELVAALEDNYGLHHVHGHGLCGPMEPEPVDAKLAEVLERCTWKARALLRECAALTESGYPAEVMWFGEEDEEEDEDAPIPYEALTPLDEWVEIRSMQEAMDMFGAGSKMAALCEAHFARGAGSISVNKSASSSSGMRGERADLLLIGVDSARGEDRSAAVVGRKSGGSYTVEMTVESSAGWQKFLDSLAAIVPSVPVAEGETLDRLAELYGLQRIRPLVSGPYRGDGCTETDEELRERLRQVLTR